MCDKLHKTYDTRLIDIAKIIDYGRCFFNDESNKEITGSSKSIYESICNNIPECNSKSFHINENDIYHQKYTSLGTLTIFQSGESMRFTPKI